MLILELLCKLLIIKLIFIKFILFYYSHFINKNFELKSYLLSMKDLNEPHSGLYLFEELLKSLQDYNIEYNISR
jgi:hypothetical protein